MKDVINKSLAAKLLALSTLALMACPTPPTNDGGTGGGGGEEECAEAADCAALKGGISAEWYCNASTALCEPACRTDNHCNPATREAPDLPQCAGALGCVCDEGRCIAVPVLQKNPAGDTDEPEYFVGQVEHRYDDQ